MEIEEIDSISNKANFESNQIIIDEEDNNFNKQ